MRTAQEIEALIKTEVSLNIGSMLKKSMKNSVNKKIYELRQAKRYMETNPSEEFVKKNVKDLKKDLIIIESRFKAWLDNHHELKGDEISAKRKYNTLFEVNKKKVQIKWLTWLLNSDKEKKQ